STSEGSTASSSSAAARPSWRPASFRRERARSRGVDRSAIWPDFRAEWVIHDDGDLIVVDKPVGVSSQAADPERPDDVVTRLKAHLGGAYLGTHQRLDRDTSGLLVFARRKEANASLAAQFEGRSVKKTYLAGVTGWPKGKSEAT